MQFSKLWTMDKKDLVNTIGTFVFSAVIGTLYTLVNTPGFSFSNINWHMVLNMIVVAVLTSLGKTASTTEEGKLLGIARVK